MSKVKEITIPDLGGASEVDVIEIQVKKGDVVEKEDALLTLEGDKATMEIPSPYAGKIKDLSVKVGDKVSFGKVIGAIDILSEATDSSSQDAMKKTDEHLGDALEKKKKIEELTVAPVENVSLLSSKKTDEEFIQSKQSVSDTLYVGPSVRRLARELEVNLHEVKGTGNKGRITKSDLLVHLSGHSSLKINAIPQIDFSQFGPIEFSSLSRIKQLSGAHLARSWSSIPHVTQFDEVDITELEKFRQTEKKEALNKGCRLTPLVFIMKAVAACLKAFPHFNASLDACGKQLILKRYYHIGFAVDTKDGLVVPVLRDVDKKGLYALAKELSDISEKARTKGLSMSDMQGGTFTLSSLGGIGGTAFTPIINAPEVAILGVSKAKYVPRYYEESLSKRCLLPLSLSYDHRVIDGAEGARFLNYLGYMLSDIRRMLFN